MNDPSVSPDILVDRRDDDIAIVTLNRPTRLNALKRETVLMLNGVLDELAADTACRAVILTGAGRGFCSGQDLAASDERNRSGGSGVIEKLFWQEQFAGMGGRIRSMPQLVIAAVNGPAVGAGHGDLACGGCAFRHPHGALSGGGGTHRPHRWGRAASATSCHA